MYGTADRFVPSNIHFQIWQDSVKRSDVTFQLFDGIDHSFGTEYDSTMSPLVLDFMADWIHNNSKGCATTSIKQSPNNLNLLIYQDPHKWHHHYSIKHQ